MAIETKQEFTKTIKELVASIATLSDLHQEYKYKLKKMSHFKTIAKSHVEKILELQKNLEEYFVKYNPWQVTFIENDGQLEKYISFMHRLGISTSEYRNDISWEGREMDPSDYKEMLTAIKDHMGEVYTYLKQTKGEKGDN